MLVVVADACWPPWLIATPAPSVPAAVTANNEVVSRCTVALVVVPLRCAIAGASAQGLKRGSRLAEDSLSRISPRLRGMELRDVVRARRTHKVYGADPIDRTVLEELFEFARWAPNHRLTNPWRFRVVGPKALQRLKDAEGDPVAAKKLDRAPTLVAVTSLSSPDASEAEREEDLMAAACAAYVVLLAATDRGLASYWRTPGVLTRPEGRAALGMNEEERFVGLLHLGAARQSPQAPTREPVAKVATFLD